MSENKPKLVWGHIPRESWMVEYEIPPLRAIYYDIIERCSAVDAENNIRRKHPSCKIRNVTPYHE